MRQGKETIDMTGETDTTRSVLKLTGSDRVDFLQGLVTNDVTRDGLVYTALLTPQGKFIADFFVLDTGDATLIDVAKDTAPALAQRLNMYKLRADVAIEATQLYVLRGLSDAPDGAFDDPRDPALGWRDYSETPGAEPSIDWDDIRVAHRIPEAPNELTPDSYILEAGFERLHGVDFKKGCYVGQEVTARMKHKTELRKGIVTVDVAGDAAPGTPITTAEGKPAGTLHTVSGDKALAYLRFDFAKGPLTAGDAKVTWTD